MKKTNNSVLSQYRGALMGISIILIIVFHFTDDCHYTPIILVAGFPSFGDIFHHQVWMHFYSFLVWGYIIP